MINKNDLISIIVKPTNACNLRCKHCYHAGTGYDNEQMSDKMLEKLISSSVPHFSGIHYIWHGGEPLSMPLTFYKRALELEQKYKHNPNQNIKNSMQSNGTYVTEDVAKFIADNNILIGFSFEGPYNDFLRSHTNMTLKGYENLKKYNIIPGTIAVVGKHNINNLIDVYEYFRNKNQPLKLNTIFASGSAKENEDILLTDPEYYAEKICELFDLWLFDTTTGISISPFYSYAQSVISGKPKYCTHSSCLKYWLSVHSNGDIYPCGRYYPEEYRLGNIMDFNDLHDVFETKIYKNIINKSAIRKQKCREQCNVYHLCNGGCLNESILAGGIENIPEFSCTAFSIIISHIKTRMQEAISRGIEFENIYNKYIRNIIKKRLEMNKNVK